MLEKLSKKDLKEIIDLHRKAIFPLWKKIGRDYNVKQIKEYVVDTLKKGVIFSYFEDKKLVGCGGVVFDKYSRGDIRLILVDPKFQGKGIGKEIMRNIEEYSEKNNIKELKLNVLIKNKAVNFYKKLGYKKYSYRLKKELR